MFYEIRKPNLFLRFGDIIDGFQQVKPIFNKFDTNKNDFQINVEHNQYFVVLTPCCSIEKQTISLTPLKPLRSSFFSNEYFVEDFTAINRLMSPQQIVPKKAWEEKFDDNERQKRLSEGNNYAFIDLFIYQEHKLLPIYKLNSKKLGKISTGFYLIDFKDTFVIESKQIQREAKLSKILQLSIQSRTELREKISAFYHRIPDEDIV